MENVERVPASSSLTARSLSPSSFAPSENARRRFPQGVEQRGMMEDLCIGVAEIGLEGGRILFANSFFCRMLGYSDDDLAGGKLSFQALVHQEDWKRKAVLHQRMATGLIAQYKIETRYRRKDGSIVWVRTTAKKLTGDGQNPRVLQIVEDITREKHLRQQLNFAGEAVAIATWSCYPGFDLLVCSPAHNVLFGISPSASPRSFGELLDRVHSEDRDEVARTFGVVGQAGQQSTEFRIVRPCVEVRSVRSMISVQRNRAGEITSYSSVMIDVTARDAIPPARAPEGDVPPVPGTNSVIAPDDPQPAAGRRAADVERELILQTLDSCHGNRTHAAKAVGISIRTLRNKLNAYAVGGWPIAAAGSRSIRRPM